MAGGKKFSLGGALFGGQPADDHAEPQAAAPDSWPLAEQAGAEGLKSLLSANRGTRDYVLRHAPKATRTVIYKHGVELAEWQRRLESAGEGLLTRGPGLNTGLRLHVDYPYAKYDCLDAVAPWLQDGVGAVVTAFTLSWCDCEVKWVYDELLDSAIAALPSLRSLSLDRCMGPLSPRLLPHLTELKVAGDRGSDREADSDRDSKPDRESKADRDAIHVSVGKLLPQLSALVYEDMGEAVWPHVFTPATTTHTLTSLTVTYLHDTLLSLLLQHAPALQHIGVEHIDLSEEHREKKWAVTRVSYKNSQRSLPIDALCNMPRNEVCRVQITQVNTIEFFDYHGWEGYQDAHIDYRLQEWSFPDVETVRLSSAWFASTAAIANGLCQLPHLHAPQATLLDWGAWAPGLAQAAAAAPPPPQGLRSTVRPGTLGGLLTDELLGLMVQAGVPADCMTVRGFCLKSYQHALARWPWRELHCAAEVDISMVDRLPCQPKDGVQPVIRCDSIAVNYIFKAEAERVQDQLQHIQWSLPQGGVIVLESSLDGEYLDTALSVVGAIRHKDASVRHTVDLRLPAGAHLSAAHVSQLGRVVGEASCAVLSVGTLTQADRDILQSRLQDTSAFSLTVYCERFIVKALTQADADLLSATLRRVKFAPPKLPDATHDNTPMEFRIEQFGTQAPSLPAQLSVLRAVSFTDEYNSCSKSVRLSARTLLAQDVHVLQGLPHWDGCLDLSACVFDGVLAAEYVSYIPVSYRVWKLGCVSREVLQSVCTAITQRRQGLGLPPVTVRTSSDQVGSVEAGEHVNLVGL